MLEGLIGEVIRSDCRMVVAGRVRGGAPLDAAVRAHRADVVIVGGQDAAAAPRYETLLAEHPHLRILLIDSSVRHGWLCCMAPLVTPVAEMSAEALVASVHARPQTRFAGGLA